MIRIHGRRAILAIGCLLAVATLAGSALADGTETLGEPVGISVASGSGIAIGGTGMFSQPASVSLSVPMDASVTQVLVYWEGQHNAETNADDTIVIDGIEIMGTLIGGPTLFFSGTDGEHWSSTYRADVTGYGFVSPGDNTLSISGMDFPGEYVPPATTRNDGVGFLVIYDDGDTSDISLRDGNDLAFINFAPTLDTTVPQLFTFAAQGSPRDANLAVFAGSVQPERPNAISVTMDGDTTLYFNLLGSVEGEEWDSILLPLTVPAGVSSMEVQLLSADDGSGRNPASLCWTASGLSIESIPPECGDGVIDEQLGETCDPPGEPAGAPNECRDDCTYCGDGVQDDLEECDDGNNTDGDGCSASCTVEAYCGDGVIDEQLGETCDPPGQPEGMPNQCREDCTFCGDGILDDFEECDDGNNENGDGCSATCDTEQTGGEGCTPGFWKQPQHFGHWVGYSPTESYYDDVFGIEASWGNRTLLAVMRQGGGGEMALGRHAVAALLNAASGGVDYAYSTDMVIQIVQDAYATGDFNGAKNMLAAQNESYCSLDGQSWLPGQERRTLRTGNQRGSALGSSGVIRDLGRR